MQQWFQYYFIIFGESALSDVIVILTDMKRRAGPVAIAVLYVSPKLIPTTAYQYLVTLLEVTALEFGQYFWHSTFDSCFPHFIKACAAAKACYSAENRRSHGFRRQPIRFFPHGHSAKYFTHYWYALRNSAKHKFLSPSRKQVCGVTAY